MGTVAGDDSALFTYTWIKPIAQGIQWLSSLTSNEIQSAKDESQELLADLSRGVVNLWRITREVARLADADFERDFPATYIYFKETYYDGQAFEAVRIHCGNLKKHINDLVFRLSVVLRTDIGQWRDVSKALQMSLLEDASYQMEYRRDFDLLNAEMNDIHGLLSSGNAGGALDKYQVLRRRLNQDLDYLNAHVQKIRDADGRFRESAR